MEAIVKGLLSLSAAAIALTLGTSLSATDAQARVRVGVFAVGSQAYYEARMPMCTKRSQGLYRTQNDTWLFTYGYCLSDVPTVW
jgi:hypothetical protein